MNEADPASSKKRSLLPIIASVVSLLLLLAWGAGASDHGPSVSPAGFFGALLSISLMYVGGICLIAAFGQLFIPGSRRSAILTVLILSPLWGAVIKQEYGDYLRQDWGDNMSKLSFREELLLIELADYLEKYPERFHHISGGGEVSVDGFAQYIASKYSNGPLPDVGKYKRKIEIRKDGFKVRGNDVLDIWGRPFVLSCHTKDDHFKMMDPYSSDREFEPDPKYKSVVIVSLCRESRMEGADKNGNGLNGPYDGCWDLLYR